ncbi:transposase [Ochrobactrum pseudogrignonense]|nr:transposase [Brucella pseudogrignonensis]
MASSTACSSPKEPEWNELPEDLQEAIKAARVCVIAAIDYRSQCIVSLWPSLTENANAAMQSFRMIMQDKSKLACSVGAASLWHMNGKPELLVFDNGSAFIDTVFRRALADCRISYAVTVGGIPWLRSRIEGAFKNLPAISYRISLVEPLAMSWTRAITLHKHARLFLSELSDRFFSYVVDGYHNMALEALGGYTPAEEWQRLVDLYGEPAESLDYDDSRAVFGATYIRTLSSSGIYFMGLYYNSTALQAWRRRHGDKKIEVRVDPQNLGRLSAHTDNEWIIVPTHRRFEGASIDGIKLMSREIQRRMKARQEAHKDILNDVRKRIQDISQAAREQSGIIHLAPTQEEIDRIEDGLTIGFTMGDVSPEDLDADDVLGAILERASLALPAPDVPAPSSVRNRRCAHRSAKPGFRRATMSNVLSTFIDGDVGPLTEIVKTPLTISGDWT